MNMKSERKKSNPNNFLAIGIALGAALGVTLDNIPPGVGSGLIIGSIPGLKNLNRK